MFIFQYNQSVDATNVAKLSTGQKSMDAAQLASYQKSIDATRASFNRQPKITDMNQVFPKLAKEHEYVLTAMNKLISGLVEYKGDRTITEYGDKGYERFGLDCKGGEKHTDGWEMHEGKMRKRPDSDPLHYTVYHTADAVNVLQEFVANLRKYVQNSDSLKGNTEILNKLNDISYGIDLLVPGTVANKEYLVYLNSQRAKHPELPKTLEDEITYHHGDKSIAYNQLREGIITKIAADCHSMKKSLIESVLTAGLAVALQKRSAQTANEIFDALSEFKGTRDYSIIRLRFAADDPLTFIDKDFNTGTMAEAERKAKILVENISYAPQKKPVRDNLQLAKYGVTPEIYYAGVTGDVGKALLQSMPVTGTAWLATDTYRATETAIESGTAVDWAKAGAYGAATIFSAWADRYVFGKASIGVRYVLGKLGVNVAREWNAMFSMPKVLAREATLMIKMEGDFKTNVNKVKELLKKVETVKIPAEEAKQVEKITAATEINKAATDLNKVVGGINEKAQTTTVLFEKTFPKPLKGTPDIAGEFVAGMRDKKIFTMETASDFPNLNNIKPGKEVRLDYENNIYIVKNTYGNVKVSLLGIKSDELQYLEKINDMAATGNAHAMAAGEGIKTEGTLSTSGKNIANRAFGSKHDPRIIKLQETLNKLQTEGTTAQTIMEKNQKELMDKLTLPAYDEIPKGKPTPNEIFAERKKSAQEKLQGIIDERNKVIAANPKDPARKVVATTTYGIKYGASAATRYGVAGIEWVVRGLTGKKFAVLTGQFLGSTTMRGTAKYLLFGFDDNSIPPFFQPLEVKDSWPSNKIWRGKKNSDTPY